MTAWDSPKSIETVTGVSSGLFLQDINSKIERLSTHGQKRSLKNILQEREQNDPAFKARMVEARKSLAEEIHDVSPEDSFAKRRLAKGLSQQRLASIIGTSQPHVAKIEAGSIKIHFDTAIKLADALGITLDDLRKLVEVSRRPEILAIAS